MKTAIFTFINWIYLLSNFVVYYIDGGQEKLIVTLIVYPCNEKGGKDGKKEKEIKKIYKSSWTQREIIVARVDAVPECNFNLKVIS